MIELILLTIPVVLVLRTVFNLGAIASLLAVLQGKQEPSVWFFSFWLILCFVFPVFFYAHGIQVIHDKPRSNFPIWLPRPRCLINGVAYLLILISAFIITLAIWIDLPMLAQENSYETQQYVERVSGGMTVTWVIVAAYLFYLKDGIAWFFQELAKLPSALIGRKQKPKPSEKQE
ncbi:MAG: hypothetical protein RI580_18325 [Halothece sp. Uz-M2-17]|nr:hypothetical protein [Halothece sp. Uz-M2-17]